MKREDIKICIIRMEGTNCEDETERAFKRVGVFAEKVHLKQLTGDATSQRKRKLSDYNALIFPGGFSAGDYIRSGAVFGSLMMSKLEKEIKEFVKEGKVIGGICNGFQVLTNTGLLPGNVEAALTNNASGKFEGGFDYVKTLKKTPFTEKVELGKVLNFAHGHGEGRLLFVPGKEKNALKELQENSQIVFRYATPEGEFANMQYPYNPNGATFDIAGISNLEGNVVGWMPHPERVLDSFNHYDFHRNSRKVGDGQVIFESLVEYLQKKF